MRSLLLRLLLIGTFFVCAYVAQAQSAMVKPKGLQPGDTIMFVAPAGDLSSKRMLLAKRRLEARGFKVIVPNDLFRSWGYLAGSDERRAAELMEAFTNPEVDAIFPGTGGYGTMRMLDLLDYDKIRANPKLFIGFSDITGLHMALAKKCNLVTFHSPNPMWGLGSESNLHPFSAKYFWRNLLMSENSTQKSDVHLLTNSAPTGGYTYEPPADAPLHTYQEGRATGLLCGGNLTLIASLTGTKYQLDTQGKVLFLEDVREAPYRIDRMLQQLKLSGQLESPAAIILGAFHKCDNDDDEGEGEQEPTFTLDQVFTNFFKGASYPVLANFPAGHVSKNATLPFGIPVQVDTKTKAVRVLESPIATR